MRWEFKSKMLKSLYEEEKGVHKYEPQGHFILDLGDEFRWFQPSKTKIADAWNGAFSWMHKMSKFRMKQPWYEPAVVDAFFTVMDRINAAIDERDLRQLKSRRLEKLKGDRSGQYSMRLNDQWRLVLEIKDDHKGKCLLVVDIEDYH